MKMDKHFIAKIGRNVVTFITFFERTNSLKYYLRSLNFYVQIISLNLIISQVFRYSSDMFRTLKFVACFRQNYGLQITSLQCNKLIFKDRLFIFLNVGYVIIDN